jgi:phage baseplate assembly protein gpV
VHNKCIPTELIVRSGNIEFRAPKFKLQSVVNIHGDLTLEGDLKVGKGFTVRGASDAKS